MQPRSVVVRKFGALEDVQFEERLTDIVRPDDVEVEVAAMGTNFADLMQIGGTYQKLPDLPFSPGWDLAGTVLRVGEDVAGVRVGDRVRAHVSSGAFQERAIIRAASCHVLPDVMSFTDAAALGLTYLTARYALLRRASLKEGETVLATGAAGGVGIATVQLAKAFGATVIAVASTEQKQAFALKHGADHAFAAADPEFRDQVRAVTNGRGADVVVETVGGKTFDAAVRATAWEGRIVATGFASGEIPAVKAGLLLVKNICVYGLQISDYRDREPEGFAVVQAELDGLYVGGLRPPIMAAYPLAEFREALSVIAEGRAMGKIILTNSS